MFAQAVTCAEAGLHLLPDTRNAREHSRSCSCFLSCLLAAPRNWPMPVTSSCSAPTYAHNSFHTSTRDFFSHTQSHVFSCFRSHIHLHARRVLGELHRSKKLGGVGSVDSMLVRLYEPILFRAMAAANAGVRRNALQLLLDAFPLLVGCAGCACILVFPLGVEGCLECTVSAVRLLGHSPAFGARQPLPCS